MTNDSIIKVVLASYFMFRVSCFTFHVKREGRGKLYHDSPLYLVVGDVLRFWPVGLTAICVPQLQPGKQADHTGNDPANKRNHTGNYAYPG